MINLKLYIIYSVLIGVEDDDLVVLTDVDEFINRQLKTKQKTFSFLNTCFLLFSF